MAMRKRKTCRQEPLFLAATELPRTPAHPFYERLNQILAENQFDPFVEELCQPFYAETLGRLLGRLLGWAFGAGLVLQVVKASPA